MTATMTMSAPAAAVPAPRPAGDGTEVNVLSELYVPEARQWLSSAAGRIAPEGYSWMQGVHWVAGSGMYEPRRYRSHGPRSFGPTTVRIAQLLAELSPCRPGIEHLMRRTGLSERTVEYHLQMLRETGLLAWELRGTRVSGERAQASVYARMLPPEFDAALGIRTAGEGIGRRVIGIAETGRQVMVQLAKKASRKVRRPRSKSSSSARKPVSRGGTDCVSGAPVSGRPRCTPMGGSSSSAAAADDISLPPENKLASGQSNSPTPPKAGRRTLNMVGRRYQLASELIQKLDWLKGCSVPRIAWVARHIADAGWTASDVHGWLHFRRGQVTRVRRGSGLLATLLRGAETTLDTPAKRAEAVAEWHSAQEATRRYRIERVRAQRERSEGDWQAPDSSALHREVDAAFAQVREVARGGRHYALGAVETRSRMQALLGDEDGAVLCGEDDVVDLTELTEEQIIDMRVAAKKDPDLIHAVIGTYDETYARRLFTHELVEETLRLNNTSDNLVITQPWAIA
ncbi:helix-turn-helix domain-containing protein [Streptomyces sp. 769]|uniref:helix-turn-helix domain-containing protein n=1 Tax=Streptomyces sp. 769 TaxID=1262452 RepID=UPI0005821A10|nr:helix-turn-helix domain-containing protein [Streptomyces sp. 769]AJC62046.1 hypothetical protein GZL_p00116 [Streptomyces sp. 769]